MGDSFARGFSSGTAQVEARTVYYRMGGMGPTVLLLHGYGATGDMWARVHCRRVLVHVFDIICKPSCHHRPLALRHVRRYPTNRRSGVHPCSTRRWIRYQWVANTFFSVRPRFADLGLSPPAAAVADSSLAARLEDATVAACGQVVGPTQFGVWARKPA
jgi:hypothetical protein